MTVRSPHLLKLASGAQATAAPRPGFEIVSPPATLAQSGLGIASLVIAMFGLLGIVVLLVVLVAAAATWHSNPPEDSAISYLIGGWIFATGILSLVGIVFGIGGLLQRQRRRNLAVIGLVLNVGLPIALMAFLVFAMTFDSRTTHREPLHWDISAWNSPAARSLRWLAVGMGASLTLRHRRKATVLLSAPTLETQCPVCRKSLSSQRHFCPRCGHAMHPANTTD